jgi:DNA helicase-2/ATP-dependent DNA helicase PcrA
MAGVSSEQLVQPFGGRVDLQIDYARELNPQQLAAVTALPGPALVLAGAGAGKTRTLVFRVAYLLEQGIPPEHILLLTFTNKAAKEMMHRVRHLLTHDLAALWGGTFHAIGSRILRLHAARLGFSRDFTILDREDATHLLKACRDELPRGSLGAHFPKADVLGEIYSLAANTRQAVEQVVARDYAELLEHTAQIQALQPRYTERKRLAQAMDFDDLLVLWLRLLQEHEELRDRYQRRFQFILVDEFQDTNQLQSDLIDLLAARHHNVMAVGDDAQSIYSWRGANFLNILTFPDRHAGTQVFRIETNYRSTPQILDVANAAIAPNTRQHRKVLAPVRRPGLKPFLVTCEDAQVQAAFVARRVLELRAEGFSPDQIAVLYRSHFHVLEVQMELTRHRIPFVILSGLRFFEQAHLKDISAYLRLLANPRDELAFKRLVRMLPGIGAQGADRLWRLCLAELDRQNAPGSARATPRCEAEAATHSAGQPPDSAGERIGEPRSDALDHPEGEPAKAGGPRRGVAPDHPGLVPALVALARDVPKRTAGEWQQFTTLLAELREEPVCRRVASLIGHILEGGYETYLQATYTNYRARAEDLEQLLHYADRFQSLEEFLADLALQTNVESEHPDVGAGDQGRLRLSTVHQAKGLEFAVVFVIMLCADLFPSRLAARDAEGEEEERRLFYVAITRAQHELYLSYPRTRYLRESGPVPQCPSPLLGPLSSALVDQRNLTRQQLGLSYY